MMRVRNIFIPGLSLKALMLLCLIGMAFLLAPFPAFASGSGGSGSSCYTASSGSGNGGNEATCGNCINSLIYQNLNEGSDVINSIFNTINYVLQNLEYSFFNGIIGNKTFQAVINTAFILYIAIFGLMITFNITSYRLGEVVNRLFKVAIVYMLTTQGAWNSFNTFIQNPVIGSMNQIIREFTVVAEGGGSSAVNISMLSGNGSSAITPFSGGSGSGTAAAGQGLDPVMFGALYASSMTTIFSIQMYVAIMATMKTGFFGWLISVFLIWALIEFFLMMLSALVTYAKAIIGLAFLFGIAPLFFIFLMFENTRDIFMTWLSHVITFALQPVLLFSFLAFYVALVNDAAPLLFTDPGGNYTTYCWTDWFSMPGTLWQVYFWAPTQSGSQAMQSQADAWGNVTPEHINVPNALYFLLLCQLAKGFTEYIDQLAQEIGGGMSAGVDNLKPIRDGIDNLFARVKGG